MKASEAVRFFNTSACLNLARPTSGTTSEPKRVRKRPVSSTIRNRGQQKIDLYNFEHLDFANSKYVLTSPRSLEACSRLNIKPITLLPRRLADVQDDIGADKVQIATLAEVREKLEINRLANLQRCREEREKIIREEALGQTSPYAREVEPQPSSYYDVTQPRRTFFPTRFNPSSSLLNGLNDATSINTVPIRSHSTSAVKFSDFDGINSLPPRATVSNSILKSSSQRWGPELSSPTHENDDLRPSSAAFLGDVRHINRNLQRMTTTETRSKSQSDARYANGLENVKEMIERRANFDADSVDFERKQYEILRGHFDHELKIQRARENARRGEKEKEIERYESLLHDVEDQSLAEERRRTELRRKIDKLHHSRNLYETLQAKNYEQQLADLKQRRLELLSEIKRKDKRTKHFMKDKEDAVTLSRTLAKSSQDIRDYIRESQSNFNEMAQKAELNSSVLVPKSKHKAQLRDFQSSIRT